ncbi:lipoyl synthase [bacterium]|nr:lipoyl synthase [bacterium]
MSSEFETTGRAESDSHAKAEQRVDFARARPPWIRVKAVKGASWRKMMSDLAGLHTVCQEANCPNIGECFGRGIATFMILGDTCTRNCRFCAVKTGISLDVDNSEPARLAESVAKLKLRHVVITSVTRDDLPDGGARAFADCIRAIRDRTPDVTIEVLTPDFQGDTDALKVVMDEKPDVFNHNVETVPRLYKSVRPEARYERSLMVLGKAKEINPAGLTKSGLMVGLGEEKKEVIAVLRDLRKNQVDMVTIGQYLQPTRELLPVARYVTPDEFDEIGESARELGFISVASGPLVRSSYLAESQLPHR